MPDAPYHTQYDETAVLKSLADGDELALKEIISRYWKDIYFVALTYIQNAEHAEEVTQDVFIKLWNGREKLHEVESFKDYIFIIARNHIFSELRKALNREPVDSNLYGMEGYRDSQHTPEHRLELKEYRELLEKAIRRLPEKRQQIFRMSRMDGMSYAEIAEKMDIKVSTVNDHLTAAMNFIRSYIRSQMPVGPISAVLAAFLTDFAIY